MSLEIIVALVFTLPIIAFITGFVWYVNLGGAWSAMKKSARRDRSRIETEEA